MSGWPGDSVYRGEGIFLCARWGVSHLDRGEDLKISGSPRVMTYPAEASGQYQYGFHPRPIPDPKVPGNQIILESVHEVMAHSTYLSISYVPGAGLGMVDMKRNRAVPAFKEQLLKQGRQGLGVSAIRKL